MTPEEKARDLVEKFKQHSYYDGHDMTTRRQREESNIDSAKECAEICVDEIIKVLDYEGYDDTDYKIKYLAKVKEAIRQL